MINETNAHHDIDEEGREIFESISSSLGLLDLENKTLRVWIWNMRSHQNPQRDHTEQEPASRFSGINLILFDTNANI